MTTTPAVALPQPRHEADGRGAASSRTPGRGGVVVVLGGGAVLVPLESVAEVARPPGLTRLPFLPAWLPGVANHRGRVLPVVDLRPLLGVDAPEPTRRARLVVLRDGETRVGLAVEAVRGVLPLPDELEPAPATVAAGTSGLVSGAVHPADGPPLAVLDVDAVLALSEQVAGR